MTSPDEESFLSTFPELSLAHVRHHLKKSKNNLANAINQHLDGTNCLPKNKEEMDEDIYVVDGNNNNNNNNMMMMMMPSRTETVATRKHVQVRRSRDDDDESSSDDDEDDESSDDDDDDDDDLPLLGRFGKKKVDKDDEENGPKVPANAAKTPSTRGRGRGRGGRGAAKIEQDNQDAAVDQQDAAAKPVGRGRGRGRGAAAVPAAKKAPAPKKKGGKKTADDDASESSSSATSSDDDDGGNDEANSDEDVPEGNVPIRLQRVQGVETPLIRRFKELAAVPLRNAAEDAACFANGSDPEFRRTLASNFNQIFAHVRRWGAENVCYGFSDPIHFMTPQITDRSEHTLINFVAPPHDQSCDCLFVCSDQAPSNVRQDLIHNALRKATVLRLFAPLKVDFIQKKGFVPIRQNPTQLRSPIVGWRFAGAHANSFNEKLGNALVSSRVNDPEVCYVTGLYAFRKCILTSVLAVEDPVAFAREALRGTSAANCIGSCQPSERTDYFLFHFRPELVDINLARHLPHQLFMRLADTLAKCSLGIQTVANTRDRLWQRRFLNETVVRCFSFSDSNLPIYCTTQVAPAFNDIFHAIATPESIFVNSKKFQAMSAKDVLDHFGKDLVRMNMDVSAVPVRPQGIVGVDLFPHQRRSVAFMIDRERNGVRQFHTSDPIPLPEEASITSRGNNVLQGAERARYTHYRFHINSALGASIATPVGSPQDREIMQYPCGRHRGGLSCSEVGMGKTLEILSLILLNRPNYETTLLDETTCDTPLRASKRHANEETATEQTFRQNLTTKLKIRATLIIAPVSLVGQWEEEIQKRSPGLKVIRYHGKETKSRLTYADFAAADIVITTFETYRLTLRDEGFWFKWFASYQDDFGGAILRTLGKNNVADINALPLTLRNMKEFKELHKSFKVLPKKISKEGQRPDADSIFLSRLHFHRIVIDEFHKQGGLSADTMLVDSDYLWLVSGTPLDANIGRFMKRFGIMDYSFVDPEHLRFTLESPDNCYNFAYDSNLFNAIVNSTGIKFPYHFQTQFMPEQERLGNYTPPAQVAVTYAQVAVLSQYMVRNTVDTCPELANVRVTEKIVKLQHSDKEKEKYVETLQKVRTELDGMRARGTLQTRILYVLTLLNNLRRAAVDPFGVTIQVRDALVVGGGAQFDRENERYNIQIVPVDIFAHLLYPETFAALLPRFDAAAPNPADRTFAHVKTVPKIETLKEELTGMMKQPPELEACMICLENLAQPTVVGCGHIFCRECILQWMQRGGAANCPACRRDSLANTKKKSLLTFPPPPQEKLPVVKKEKSDDVVPVELDEKEKERLARIPTKIRKVMEIIRETINDDHTSKFLVFTAFPSILTFLQDELNRAAIGSVIIDGSSTLNQRAERIKLFQDLSSFNVRVCILSSRVGNMGLTLISANTLIIVEPATNIDVDTQILGRVKRIGQKRAVACHRLIIEDSIEVPMHELVQSRTVSLSAGGSDAAKKAVTDTIMKLVYPTGVPPVEMNGANLIGMNGGGGGGMYLNDNNNNNNNHHMMMMGQPQQQQQQQQQINNNNNNQNNQVGDDGLTAYERQQMEQILMWERQHGVIE